MEKLSVPHSECDVGDEQESGVNIDIKTGEICLILEENGKVSKHKVYMKIFKNSYEHHAQLYTDAGCMSLKYALGMRNCSIKVDEPQKRIAIYENSESIGSDNKRVLFEVSSTEEVLEWVKSLTPARNLQNGSVFSPASPKRAKLSAATT